MSLRAPKAPVHYCTGRDHPTRPLSSIRADATMSSTNPGTSRSWWTSPPGSPSTIRRDALSKATVAATALRRSGGRRLAAPRTRCPFTGQLKRRGVGCGLLLEPEKHQDEFLLRMAAGEVGDGQGERSGQTSSPAGLPP